MMSHSASPSLCLRSSSPFGARSLVSWTVSESATRAAALGGSCLRTPLNSGGQVGYAGFVIACRMWETIPSTAASYIPCSLSAIPDL